MPPGLGLLPAPQICHLPATPSVVVAPGATVAAPQQWHGLVARFVRDVADDCGLGLAVAPGPDGAVIELRLVEASELPARPVLGISPDGTDPADERHTVDVADGRVVVRAVGAAGAFRGLTTVRQLLAGSTREGGGIPALHVEDWPRFAWRGLSFDVVRTFHPPRHVEQVIDLLALHKANVLHLHLSDDQGWRLEVPGRPELTAIGGATALGRRPGGFYTRAELDALVAYAAERFVTVVPEIDLPGHCAAAVAAIPSLTPVPPDGPAWPPRNLLLPGHPGVLEFTAEVIAELADVAPGPFVHLGGDEALGMAEADYVAFVDAARAMVRARGKRAVAWQESARGTLGPDDVVQHWVAFGPALDAAIASGDPDAFAPPGERMSAEHLRALIELLRRGRDDIARAVAAGAHVLLSPASNVYLDRPYADDTGDPAQRERRERLGLPVYPRTSLEDTFSWDPVRAIDAPADQLAGVEAAIWCETVRSFDDLMFLLLPRLAGVAEHAWSAPTTWPEHRERLAAQAPVWRRRGWAFFEAAGVPWAT